MSGNLVSGTDNAVRGKAASGAGIADSGVSWDELRRTIENSDADAVVAALAGLDDAGRKEVAAKLPGLIRTWQDITDWNAWQRTNQNLLIAGAACLSGAAAAAAWLSRANLETPWNADLPALARIIADVTAHRGLDWQLDLAHRLAAKLRGTPARADRELRPWHMAAEIFSRTRTEPPVDDGFVLMWVRATAWPAPAADPFRKTLAPRLLEVDAVGPLLQWEREDDAPRAQALVSLAAAGELDRESVLDGCVRRLLRGGTLQQLRWYLLVHQLLAPTLDELRTHQRDYLRLLPTAPSTVADMAFRVLKQLDDADGLAPEVVEEAASALLFRTEKKLLTGTLTWLDRTARKRDRVDTTVLAVCAVFSSDSLDLLDRAAALAIKYEPAVSPEVREAVREAAATLPQVVSARIVTAYGGEAAEPVEVFAPMAAATAMPRAFTSVEELAAALAGEPEGPGGDVEHLLAAIVDFAHRDRENAKTVLAEALPFVNYYDEGPHAVVRALLHPNEPIRRQYNREHTSIPGLALGDRITEIAHRITAATLPVLLATPTEPNGLLDPHTLIARIRRYEELGLEPGPLDLKQALLRLPAEPTQPELAASVTGHQPAPTAMRPEAEGVAVSGLEFASAAAPPESAVAEGNSQFTAAAGQPEFGAAPGWAAIVAEAGRLTSAAGRVVAEWLRGSDRLEPEITCGVVTPVKKARAWHFYDDYRYYYGSERQPRLLAMVRTPSLDRADRRWTRLLRRSGSSDAFDDLFQLPGKSGRRYPGNWYYGSCAAWPSLLPSHPEVIAAHLLAGRGDICAALPGLAIAAGPHGMATAVVLAHGLAAAELDRRAVAVDALLTFVARDRLPAAELGTAIGLLAKHEEAEFKLGRLAAALTDAVRSGAAAALWPTFAVALPALIPGARPGLPDLIALATQSAAAASAWHPIAEVTELAGRSGSSRMVREAKRLQAQLEAR